MYEIQSLSLNNNDDDGRNNSFVPRNTSFSHQPSGESSTGTPCLRGKVGDNLPDLKNHGKDELHVYPDSNTSTLPPRTSDQRKGNRSGRPLDTVVGEEPLTDSQQWDSSCPRN